MWLQSLGVCDYPYRVDCGNSTSAYPTEAPSAADGAQQQQGAEMTPEEVWRLYQQQQFRLPANGAYYGGFAHLPPVRIAPGKHQYTFIEYLIPSPLEGQKSASIILGKISIFNLNSHFKKIGTFRGSLA